MQAQPRGIAEAEGNPRQARAIVAPAGASQAAALAALLAQRRVAQQLPSRAQQPGQARRIAYLQRALKALRTQLAERERTLAELNRLHEAELESRVAERTRELATLYDVTTAASDSLDLQSTLDRVLELVLDALQCQAGAIQLLDDAGTALSVASQRGLSADMTTRMNGVATDLMTQVLTAGQPLVVTDPKHDPSVPSFINPAAFAVYLGAPLLVGGKPLGILSVFAATDRSFRVEDVALLSSVADHLGVAVDNARLRQKAEAAAAMQERERLARELHDSVAQSLFSLILLAHTAHEQADQGLLDGLDQSLGGIDTVAHQTLKDIRLLLYELRQPVLEQGGLLQALRYRLDAVEARAGIKARVLAESLAELPPAVEDALHRIALEALNNALKHANAAKVTVRFRCDDGRYILDVSDDGVGFDVAAARSSGGMGLSGMSERAAALGGEVTVTSRPGHGTTVSTWVPMAPPALTHNVHARQQLTAA